MRFLARIATFIILLAVLVFGIFFSLQNDSLVPLDLLFVQFDPNWLALWVLLAFAGGGAAGLLMGSAALLGIKRDQLALKRQLLAANKELDKLRATGLKV